MKREKRVSVEIPEGLLPDFRLFVVLHGGKIVTTEDIASIEPKLPENLQDILSEFNGGNKQTIINQFEKWDNSYLISLFALAAISLAYRYVEEDKNPWDDRNRKSKEYSYENLERFKEIYEEYSGCKLPDIEPGKVYLSKAVYPKDLREIDHKWLSIINSEHPTIFQSYFRSYANHLAKELSIPEEGFPYI